MTVPITKHGSVLIEDVLIKTIQKGLKLFKEQPTLIDDVIKATDSDTIQQVKDFLAEHKEIEVFYGYGKHNRYPCVTVTPTSETESFQPVGQHILDEIDEESGIHMEYLGSKWTHNLDITTWTIQPFRTTILYMLVRHILVAAGSALEECGLYEVTRSGGPLKPASGMETDRLFERTLTLSADTFVVFTNRFNSLTDITVLVDPTLNDPC